ncbi:PH-like domain-containing protein [Cellulomonas carbonis]|uniref:PH domain-containing protein n=1 Tax=Cellulomonas carbonis T26 TaxID=947969 RepID=A0A0A0BMS5_9CELL|nr:hypothetical protein [Cellulomonas carbonis]KGM09231.1 hypothetical protein N868_03100 [Cellulomonas carbonis T26]GGB94255.1 hypothetical protein GCM10010972_03650 [Cellulomonas carbonis]
MTSEQVLAVAVLVLVFVGVVAVMARSWLRRESASTAATTLTPAPADLGTPRSEAMEGTYVSTVDADDPLTRVPGHGLGRRSAAVVRVHDAGVVVEREGETDLFVPTADLVDAHRASGVAGKHVGGEGLVLLRWRLATPEGPQPVDTGLRLRHPAHRSVLTDAVRALVADASAGATPSTPTEES